MVVPSGSGTVNAGVAGRLALYPASASTIDDQYTQNTKTIDLDIAAQPTRSTNLALTIPNPGDAVATASVVLTEGATTINGAITLGSDLAMGTHKVTGLGNGTAATDAAAFGQIFGGFQAPVQATNTTAFTTTSSTYQTTNCSATITPTSSTHRIKITVSGVVRNANSALASAFVTLANGTTTLASTANGFQQLNISVGASTTPCAITFINSPATTSATTYNVRIKNDDNTTIVGFGNAFETVMILEEIV
jgi:hypothetical protein